MALTDNKGTPAPEKAGSGSGRPPASGRPAASGRPPLRGGRQMNDEFTPSSPFSIGSIRSGVVHSAFMKIVLGLLIAIFAVGYALSGLGGPPGGQGTNGAASPVPDPIAVVGSQNIAGPVFQNSFLQQIQFMESYGQKPGPAEMLSTRQRALDSLIQDAVLYEAAQAAGVSVSGAEIDAEISKMIDDQFKSSGNDAATRRRVEAKYGSIANAKQEMRQDYKRDEVEKKLMRDKFEKQTKESFKVTEADYKKSVTKLNLYQITLRPKFTPPTEKDVEAARNKNAAEVKARAEKLAAQLKGKPLAAFQAAAKKDSEDFMSKPKGGAIGWKLPSELLQMPADVRDQLVASTGQFVGPIQDETTKDQYLFFVADRVLKLPDDYNKKGKKEEYIKNFTTQHQSEKWTKFLEETKKTTKTEIYDPALVAYKMQTEQIYQAPPAEQDKMRRDAVARYEEAAGQATGSMKSAIYYQMAQLYRDLKETPKQIATLQLAVKENPDDNTSRIDLARALREAKKPKEAIAELQTVSKNLDEESSTPSMFGGGNPNDMLRQQVASEYDELKRKDLADKERKKIKPPTSPGMGGMGGMPPGIQMQ